MNVLYDGPVACGLWPVWTVGLIACHGCLVRTVAPGEGLWDNPACLIEASSATSGDEMRLRTTATLRPAVSPGPVCSTARRRGPASGRVWDSTRPGGYLGRRYRAGPSRWRELTDQGACRGPTTPVLGSSLLYRWQVIAHPCPWTVHLHEWLRTANGSCLLRNSNETSQYHRRGVALLDTLWQSNQPFCCSTYVSQSCLG